MKSPYPILGVLIVVGASALPGGAGADPGPGETQPTRLAPLADVVVAEEQTPPSAGPVGKVPPVAKEPAETLKPKAEDPSGGQSAEAHPPKPIAPSPPNAPETFKPNSTEPSTPPEAKQPNAKIIQPKEPIPVPGRMEKVIPQGATEAAKPKLPPLPPWEAPRPEEVRDKVFGWLAGRSVPPEHRGQIEQLWAGDFQQLSGLELLRRVVMTYALVDRQAAELVKLCSAPRIHLILPSFPWLEDPKTDPYMAANLRLFYGRWLVHEMLYEEALQMLGDLNPEEVADPATLLFYQSVANYFLLHQQEGLRRLEALLREPERCPRRYVALATLMQEDLRNLREETLDHISRRMKDVERRLGLYRAGPKVRHIQDKIVEDLDKIIQRLEEQQQQQGGSGAAGGRTIRSSRPAPDSRIIGGKGPGEVEKRDIGSSSGWGNLPPKQRQEVLQQIGRDFPAQYRDKIEQYFRRLAESAEPNPSP